ncbi:DUF2877 domain-containing protein [Kineosporia sp. A_224]|uniref:oxamate carbamoyltransferase subunit AllH family protein n=1 Tax=Kineosporia sp. A_224 TaxID=1962180 RepID=UPI000B4B9888|nr:DUF2877 domain-containing protein [Kineosporia sp. A_224]
MAAASTTLRTLLLGPVRALRVVATTPRALYLAVGEQPVVALLAPDAVRVPFGMVLDARVPPHLAGAAVGDEALVGGGGLSVAGVTVRPLRWWDPAVPALHVVASRVATGLARLLPAAPEEVATRLPALGAALAALGAGPHAGLAAAVRTLVGRGPGLTPAGDDVLAGALCALAAARPPCPARQALADVVRAELHRTTPVSAALLAEAVEGRAVPQVVDLLRTLGRPGDEGRLRAAVDALVDVGHTSGTALGHGLVLGLRAAVPGPVAA